MPGSAVAGALAISPVPQPPQRPTTRLQQGINKPKGYTDGTVRWCMVAMLSAGEPTSVDETFANKDWVAAMIMNIKR